MSFRNFSRRDLFKMTGSMVGSAAVASMLRAFQVEAATATIPKRVVMFFTPHGTVWNQWRPGATGTAFDLTKSNILSPLAPFAKKVVALEGVGLPVGGPGAPHTRGPAVLFTGSGLADDKTFTRADCSGGCSFGWNTSRSVDQEIANRLGAVTPYKSLEFGVVSGGGFPGSHISYAAPAQPMVPKQDPYVAFQQLFATLNASAADRLKEITRRQNVINAIRGDLTGLTGRISKSDLTRLQAHAESINEIETALQFAAQSCTVPAAPAKLAASDPTWRKVTVDRHSDLIAASLACGLTRVASLQYRPGENDGGSSGIYDWLGQTTEHHLSTHDTSQPAQDLIGAIYKWYAERFAYLLQQLDKYKEADGTSLLDHTMVVWGSEIGEGNTHDIKNVPFVVAGGGAAGLKLGQYLKIAPTMNHRLLVSMLHFMGYTDVNTFGNLDTGSGPLPGLFL